MKKRKDPGPSLFARDVALERVEFGSEEWIAEWYPAILRVAQSLGTFTTDDLWDVIPKPSEPRAMGAVMHKVAKQGRIRSTGEYRRSTEVSCHARPKAVWEWVR